MAGKTCITESDKAGWNPSCTNSSVATHAFLNLPVLAVPSSAQWETPKPHCVVGTLEIVVVCDPQPGLALGFHRPMNNCSESSSDLPKVTRQACSRTEAERKPAESVTRTAAPSCSPGSAPPRAGMTSGLQTIFGSRLREGFQGQDRLQRLGVAGPGLWATNSRQGEGGVHSQLVLRTDRHATWGPWNPSSLGPRPGLL